MKVNRIKATHVLAVALSISGCELIGPQIHTKLPLPQVNPTQEEPAAQSQEIKDDDSKKTTKVEIFSGAETDILGHSAISGGNPAGGKGEYSLNFDDADLGEVAKVILSDILGKNYTISPQVAGKVTLQTTKPLTKDELMPTLDMLLSINNAALVNQGGMYLIKPSSEALYNTSVSRLGVSSTMPSGYQVRVIPVKNVAASEVADILKPLLPEKSLLHVDPKRNILLVAGSGGDLNRVVDLVSIFDIDVLRGRSFALFTPAHVDASVIIEELDQIFNNSPATPAAGGAPAKKDKDAGGAASSPDSFYRFIEIDRLNAILAIAHNPQYLKDIETWVLRLDKTNTEGKGGVNVYRAQHHSAVDLAHTLSNIFGSGSQGSNSASIASGRRSMTATNRSGGSGSGNNSMGNTGGFNNSGGGIGGSNNQTASSSLGGGRSGNNSSNSGFGGSGTGFGNTGAGGGAGAMGGGGQSLMPNVKIIADEGNNALIIVANTQEYAVIQRVLKQLDVLPLQVMIDATIVEVTLNDDLKYGIEWYMNQTNSAVNAITGGANTSKDSTITALATAAASGVSTGGFSYLFSSRSGDISAVLKAAATNNNINVISSPSLMVLNNQEAMIQVGDSVPTISSTSTSLVSTGVTSNAVQMVDTGVNLSIKPRVNANGLVLMDLMQSVNQAVATTFGVTNSPTIQKRQIETSVAVQSGETIVLGGLIREENDYNRYGVPWFHELPVLGPLFGSTTRNKDKTELVVLLTPRVMKSRQDAQDVTEEFKRKLTGIYDENIRLEVEEMQ